MTKMLLAVAAAGLIGTSAPAVDQPARTCCKGKAQASAKEAKAGKLRCLLTDKVVDKCCCVERAGRIHCTLADKDVATCCCRPVEPEQKKS